MPGKMNPPREGAHGRKANLSTISGNLTARGIEAEQSTKYLQQQLGRTGSIEIQQSIYRLIESNTKTIALANAREDYAFRIIDPAVTPERRVRPKRLLILAVGTVLGVFTAVGWVLLRRAVERERAATPR